MAQERTRSGTMGTVQAHSLLGGLDYGEHGLTRHELRDHIPSLPDEIFLHLPDSKRFRSADAVLHEVGRSAGRAEGEFVAANDETGTSAAARVSGEPAGYGADPLVADSIVGDTSNRPVAGFDGNSLETETEFQP